MRMKLATAVGIGSLALTCTAQASPRLAIPRARTAIARVEHVSVGRCHRNGPLKVRCQVSETISKGTYVGWTFTFTAEATLRQSGQVEVTTPDL